MRYRAFTISAFVLFALAGTATAQAPQGGPATPATHAPPATPATHAPPATLATHAPPATHTTPATTLAAPAKPKTIVVAQAQKPAAPQAQASRAGAGKGGKPQATARPGAHAEPQVRRGVAGMSTFDDARIGAESPELAQLAAAERELFPPAMPNLGTPWPTDLPSPIPDDPDHPRAHASGLPPAPPQSGIPTAEGGRDVSWLAKLDLPDLPVRWDARVVRYIEFFKDDPRGRAIFSLWLRRSGKYRETIRKTLRRRGMPEDLMYLAMIESGFEPTARSPVGAQGVWQFMPETGRLYGLTQDRWADQRQNVGAATEAAADYLADLYRRFGSWELAMASYNMGYGGMMVSLRRYNTNDYWALSRAEGSLPWETTLYVPKIVALAVIGKNLATFGFKDVTFDSSLDGQEVLVPPQTSLASVAQAAGVTAKEIAELNPELRAQRTPPGEPYPVKVPPAKVALCTQNLPKVTRAEPPTEKYTVRFGETVDQIAQSRGCAAQKIVELNALSPGEVVRGGTVLLVPPTRVGGGANGSANGNANAKTLPPQSSAPPPGATASNATPPVDDKAKPIVVVPQDVFVYPDRKRVFYRVIAGDQLPDIAKTFKLTVDDIRKWNDIDPAARLIEGMTLQLFLPEGTDVSGAVLLAERDVTVVHPGSDEFFTRFEDKGRKRLVIAAKPNETVGEVGKRYGVSGAMMERINRRPRGDVLHEGESVVVYIPGASPAARPPSQGAAQAKNAPPAPLASIDRTEPVPELIPDAPPPAPDLLPPLPQ